MRRMTQGSRKLHGAASIVSCRAVAKLMLFDALSRRGIPKIPCIIFERKCVVIIPENDVRTASLESREGVEGEGKKSVGV